HDLAILGGPYGGITGRLAPAAAITGGGLTQAPLGGACIVHEPATTPGQDLRSEHALAVPGVSQANGYDRVGRVLRPHGAIRRRGMADLPATADVLALVP